MYENICLTLLIESVPCLTMFIFPSCCCYYCRRSKFFVPFRWVAFQYLCERKKKQITKITIFSVFAQNRRRAQELYVTNIHNSHNIYHTHAQQPLWLKTITNFFVFYLFLKREEEHQFFVTEKSINSAKKTKNKKPVWQCVQSRNKRPNEMMLKWKKSVNKMTNSVKIKSFAENDGKSEKKLWWIYNHNNQRRDRIHIFIPFEIIKFLTARQWHRINKLGENYFSYYFCVLELFNSHVHVHLKERRKKINKKKMLWKRKSKIFFD